MNDSSSYADVLRKLGMSEHGANRKTLRKVIDEYQLDLTIINENRQNAKRSIHGNTRIPLSEILKPNTSY